MGAAAARLSACAGVGFGLLSPITASSSTKRGTYPPRGNDDANSFVDAFAGEILVKSLPQQTGVIANNVVFAGVVSVGSSKDLFADLLLGDLASLIEQILFANIEDKAGEKFGFDEALAAGDTSRQMPSR